MARTSIRSEEGFEVVLKNTFLQLQLEESPEPLRPRAGTDTCIMVTSCDAGKPQSSLSDNETEAGSNDEGSEFPSTDDESSNSQEPAAFDFEHAAKENVRVLRESMSNARRSKGSSSSGGGSSSSSSSSSGACAMPMSSLLAANMFLQSSGLMPQPFVFVIDQHQQAAVGEEASGRKRKQRAKPSQEQVKCDEKSGWTTVMMRNLPRDFSRAVLMKLLDDNGFAGKYNFLYMPIDFVRQAGLGYAFLNLVTPEVVQEFWDAFDGFSAWPVSCEKVCRVNWSSPHQGYDEHVQRYRNSPLMHEDVPDECRPVLLENGMRVNFPPPTKTLKAPRLRAAKQRCAFWDQDQAEASDAEAPTQESQDDL